MAPDRSHRLICPACDYDVRTQIEAGILTCPECGGLIGIDICLRNAELREPFVRRKLLITLWGVLPGVACAGILLLDRRYGLFQGWSPFVLTIAIPASGWSIALWCENLWRITGVARDNHREFLLITFIAAAFINMLAFVVARPFF